MSQSYITNPEAVGDPNQTPQLFAGSALIALLKPCQDQAHDGTCNGVNGYHAEGCPLDTEQRQWVRAEVDCCGHAPHPAPCDVPVTLGQRMDGDAIEGVCGCKP